MASASACTEDLNLYCGRLIKLAPMQRVPMPLPPFESDRKVGAVAAFVGDRPTAWLDDEFGEIARRWARERRAPTLLVDVDPTTGLTVEMIDLLTAWPGTIAAP
jgi:hypothetical protein